MGAQQSFIITNKPDDWINIAIIISQGTNINYIQLLRDQGRPPDTSNMDFILAMFPKSRQEAECILILGTFVELVDKETV